MACGRQQPVVFVTLDGVFQVAIAQHDVDADPEMLAAQTHLLPIAGQRHGDELLSGTELQIAEDHQHLVSQADFCRLLGRVDEPLGSWLRSRGHWPRRCSRGGRCHRRLQWRRLERRGCGDRCCRCRRDCCGRCRWRAGSIHRRHQFLETLGRKPDVRRVETGCHRHQPVAEQPFQTGLELFVGALGRHPLGLHEGDGQSIRNADAVCVQPVQQVVGVFM